MATKAPDGPPGVHADADVLRRLRKELGLNQEEAARAAGISQQALSLIESGKTSGESKAAQRLREVYSSISRARQILAASKVASRNGNEIVDPLTPGGRGSGPPAIKRKTSTPPDTFARHMSIDADGRVLVTIFNDETVISYHPDPEEAERAIRFWTAVKAAQKVGS